MLKPVLRCRHSLHRCLAGESPEASMGLSPASLHFYVAMDLLGGQVLDSSFSHELFHNGADPCLRIHNGTDADSIRNYGDCYECFALSPKRG
jgi:hypothetical protein